jgi:thioredoxin reductase (NADPH)
MRKVVVIGGGVAGLQAAVFTAKAGEETLVLDSGESLVLNTSNIQNLITHDSIAGQEVLKRGKEKLGDFDGEFREEEVKKLERTEEGFSIETSEDEYESEYIVIASAGNHDFIEFDLDYEDGVEGPYMMDEHIETDDSNRAAEGVYAAGLANSWEYQTSTAIGDGAKAAVNLLSEIRGEPFTDHDT